MGEAEGVGAVGEDVEVEAGAEGHHPGGKVWDGLEGVQDGWGPVEHVLGVEREVGVWHGEGEAIGGAAEREGVAGGLHGGALEVAGEVEVEARAGCLEWRRLGSPAILPVLTVS